MNDMNVLRANEAEPAIVYGLECQAYTKKLFEEKLPFGSMTCIVKPGVTSEVHNHHEYECFFILKGSGIVKVGDRQETVSEGDIIKIPPFEDHTIYNPHDKELHFLTFWWEDLQELVANDTQAGTDIRQRLIFSTPPTPNGDLHLGHLSGPYTGADIYKRYLDLKGVKSFHVTGRDDNQSYVPRKALDEKRSPAELADDYSVKIQKTLKDTAIDIAHYGDPNSSPYHANLTCKVFKELFDKGLICAQEKEALFCIETGRYLYEAHVRGLCPHCHSPSDGNACEQCGRPNDVADLLEPESKYGSQGVEKRAVRRLYFKLSAFAGQLKQYHREVIMPAHLITLCEKMLSDGLPDICVSHLSDWGIPVPVQGFEDQRIYVWFEMASGYLAAAQETAEKFDLASEDENGWKKFFASEQADVVHFFGFDNGYFHAVLFPAVFFALDWGIRPPSAFVVNELLNLEGQKFSTSRGHLIWGSDLLRLVPSDYVRYYLSYVRPETQKTNFTLSGFVQTIDEQLVGHWQGWLGSLFSRTQKLFDGRAPAPGAWNTEHRAFFEFLSATLRDAEKAYQLESFSPQRVCRLANELVRESARFSASQQFYEETDSAYDLLRTGIALELAAARSLALVMAPIMPEFARKLWHFLEGGNPVSWEAVPAFVEDGRQLDTSSLTPFFTSAPGAINDL